MGFRDAADEGKTDSGPLSGRSHERVEGVPYDLRVSIRRRIREFETGRSEEHRDLRIGRRMHQRVGREVPEKGSKDLRVGGNGGRGVGSGGYQEAVNGSGTCERIVQNGAEVSGLGLGKGSGCREKQEVVDGITHHADFGNGGFEVVLGAFFHGKRQLHVALSHGERGLEFVGDVTRVGAFTFGELFDGTDDLSRERERNEEKQE